MGWGRDHWGAWRRPGLWWSWGRGYQRGGRWRPAAMRLRGAPTRARPGRPGRSVVGSGGRWRPVGAWPWPLSGGGSGSPGAPSPAASTASARRCPSGCWAGAVATADGSPAPRMGRQFDGPSRAQEAQAGQRAGRATRRRRERLPRLTRLRRCFESPPAVREGQEVRGPRSVQSRRSPTGCSGSSRGATAEQPLGRQSHPGSVGASGD